MHPGASNVLEHSWHEFARSEVGFVKAERRLQSGAYLRFGPLRDCSATDYSRRRSQRSTQYTDCCVRRRRVADAVTDANLLHCRATIVRNMDAPHITTYEAAAFEVTHRSVHNFA